MKKKRKKMKVNKKAIKNAAEFFSRIKRIHMLTKKFWNRYDREYKKREKNILIGG